MSQEDFITKLLRIKGVEVKGSELRVGLEMKLKNIVTKIAAREYKQLMIIGFVEQLICPFEGNTCDRSIEGKSAIALDKFKGNVGGERFQCILTAPAERKIFDTLPDRSSHTIQSYIQSFPNREEVEYVIMDMNRGYRDIARSFFRRQSLLGGVPNSVQSPKAEQNRAKIKQGGSGCIRCCLVCRITPKGKDIKDGEATCLSLTSPSSEVLV